MTATKFKSRQLDTEVLTASNAAIVTNKRVEPRLSTGTTVSTLTPEIDTYDTFLLAAQDQDLFIANHSTSTPAHGETIVIEIQPDATPRAITYDTNYVAKAGVAMPSSTTANKRLTLGFRWAADLDKYNLYMAPEES